MLLTLIIRPSVGRGLGLEEVSRGKKMYVEQTCVYLIVKPSVGRGLRLVRCISRKLVAFGGSRVKTRRCISSKEDCCLRNCKAFGGSRVKTRRCN